jgi:hypothetical protein
VNDKLELTDRLRIGTIVAAPIRARANNGRARKITVVDKDGNAIKTITDVELAKSVLARADIEFSVEEGEKRLEGICVVCALLFIRPKGKKALRCPSCKNPKCRECGKQMSRKATDPVKIKKRMYALPLCRDCWRLSRTIDLMGQKFGDLVVVSFVGPRKKSKIWDCQCSCGRKSEVSTRSLMSGHTKTCGDHKAHPRNKKRDVK